MRVGRKCRKEILHFKHINKRSSMRKKSRKKKKGKKHLFNRQGYFNGFHFLKQKFKQIVELMKKLPFQISLCKYYQNFSKLDNPSKYKPFTLFVNLFGESKTIDLPNREVTSVSELKKLIETKCNVLFVNQTLTFGGKPLRDQLKLSDYNIHHGSTLVILEQLKGGEHSKILIPSYDNSAFLDMKINSGFTFREIQENIAIKSEIPIEKQVFICLNSIDCISNVSIFKFLKNNN